MRPASNSFNTLLFSVILLTGIAISITGSKLLFDYSHEQGQLWIERHVESRAEELQLRIEATLRLLSATAALFHANPSASRDEFRRFVVANLDQHTDTIAIAWVPRISDDQRQQFESDLVSLGGRWKKIIDPNSHGLRAPALRQAEYFPIKFLVSTVDNELSPGINLGALYKTRKRLQLASQSAELLTTQAIRLTRGKPGLITFQAFLPVYRDGSANATGAGRSDELTGFIMGQFDIRALVEESFGREELLSLVLFDVDARPADQLLFQSNMAGDAALTLHEMSDLAKIEQPYWTRYFDVGNRKWLAAFVGTTGLPQQNLNWLPYIGLFAGLLITSLLALYLFIAQSRTRQVQDLKTESQAKTHFIQAISHDLRQPLHSISLNLSRFDQSLDEPSRMQLVEKLKQAVTGLNNMFDSLLDITRLEAGVITPVVREFAIDNVLTELGDEFDLVASQKGIELNQRSQPLMVKTDPVLLERVLRNLLNNAVKYTGSGKILLACRKQGDVARVVIMDTGPGIDPGQITVITEPYQRGAEVSAAEGLGLGLAIVKQTTDLLHLPFRIHSTPGRGSCFTLDIPLAVAIAREHKHTDHPQAGRILVIDDDIEASQAMIQLLENRGYETTGCTTAAGARAVVEKTRPDLVISDYHLPDGNGIDLIHGLRKKCHQELPAVLVTADPDSGIRQRCDSGNISFLAKPLQPLKLQSLLHHLLHTPGDSRK